MITSARVCRRDVVAISKSRKPQNYAGSSFEVIGRYVNTVRSGKRKSSATPCAPLSSLILLLLGEQMGCSRGASRATTRGSLKTVESRAIQCARRSTARAFASFCAVAWSASFAHAPLRMGQLAVAAGAIGRRTVRVLSGSITSNGRANRWKRRSPFDVI